jgi:hypothetical protein
MVDPIFPRGKFCGIPLGEACTVGKRRQNFYKTRDIALTTLLEYLLKPMGLKMLLQ